jgi:hypothetical protein
VEMQVLSNAKLSSYSRVEAHLLQKGGKGIGKCPNVTYEMLCYYRFQFRPALLLFLFYFLNIKRIRVLGFLGNWRIRVSVSFRYRYAYPYPCCIGYN